LKPPPKNAQLMFFSAKKRPADVLFVECIADRPELRWWHRRAGRNLGHIDGAIQLAAAFDTKVTFLLRFCNKSTPQHKQMLVFTLP